MGTAHSTWLLSIVKGLRTNRKRSEPSKYNAGREIKDLSNAAAENGV